MRRNEGGCSDDTPIRPRSGRPSVTVDKHEKPAGRAFEFKQKRSDS